MIVISRSLLLATPATARLSSPFILWRNVVTADMLSADSEAEGYPVTNLANVSTIERWHSATTDLQYVTVTSPVGEIDSVGIARHNFGTGQIAVTLEGLLPGEDAVWEALTDEYLPADDRPIVFRITSGIYAGLRLRLQPAATEPRMAVLYAGKALIMPRGITAPHAPLDQAHETQAVNGMSESGEFLGRIITGQQSRTSAQFSHLDIDWYYEHMAEFVQRGAAGPFFFAWLPVRRPRDVGFSWLTADPRPSMGSVAIDVTLEIGGIVR